MNQRTDRSLAAWIALLLFGVYLLSYSGRVYSQDSLLMLSTTESFVKRGEFNADQLWTLYKTRGELGSDGEAYSKTGYGAALFAAPLYALALVLPGDPGLVQTTLLTSSLVIALTGALVYLAARRLQFARGVSVITALLFGLATPAWVYAKQFWSEPYALFTLFAAFYFLLCYRDEGRARDALIAGILLGLAVAIRLTNAALVPLFAWYAFDFRAFRALSRPFARSFASFALPLLLFALTIAWYNWARYGNPLNSGYRPDETFDNPLLLGLYGLLFSPGKGLFVYVPFLAALPVALPLFYRRARRELLLMLLTFAFYLLTFSMWYYWWGGTNWSARFLVPTLPFLVLLVAPTIELALGAETRVKWRRAFTPLFFLVCLLSFAVELLGVSIPALAYRNRMVRLTPNPEADAIFLPQSSPLIGYFNLLKPTALDFAWVRVADGSAVVDGLVVVLVGAFVLLCLWGLLRSIADCGLRIAEERSQTTDDGQQIKSHAPGILNLEFRISLAFLLAVCFSLISLYRYRDDARWGGGDGYRALVQTVAREAQARDVLILNDDARTPFFLNENRARLRWYGLSRDPQQWDEATRALLRRVSIDYARVWFAYDDATDALDPARVWLSESFRPIAAHDFDDGVHLILFAVP